MQKEVKERKQKKKYEIDMCNGPLLKKMLLFTVPLMASSILQLLFNAADVVVVGRFAGDNSLAAVGSTASIIHLMVNLFIGMSIGANVLAARYYGAKKSVLLSQTIHTAMLLSVVSGLLLATIGAVGSSWILRIMQSPEEVIDLATIYLRIYFLGMPAMLAYNFGSAILRAVGDTRRPLYYLAGSGVVNVVLNLIFVVFFHMDVAGVALATILSQYLSAALIIRCMLNGHGSMKLRPKLLMFHKDSLIKIMQIGIPAGLSGVLFSFSNVIIQSSVNSFGSVVVAGNSAAGSVEGFTYVAMNSFAQAAISFTSQNVGAGKYKRVRKVMLRAVCCGAMVGLVMGCGCYLLAKPLLSLYSKSAEVIAVGTIRLFFICVPYFICGIMDIMVGVLRGLGYSVLPTIVSLIGACGLRIVWISTVFQIPKYHTIETIYISYPVTWAITAITHIICYVVIMNGIKKRQAQRANMPISKETEELLKKLEVPCER